MLTKITVVWKFLRPTRNPLGLLGALLVMGIGFLALLAPIMVPYSPYAINLTARLEPPSWHHFFGTDALGRDIFSRVIMGARISLEAALVIISLSFLFGTVIGTVCGLIGSWIDDLLMRFTDSFLAFPYLIFAMLVSAILGPNLRNAMLAISVTWWPWYARLTRGQVLSAKNKLYIEAAKAVGIGKLRLFTRYLFPNAFSPLIVQATLDIGNAILLTASLSFIGLGAQPPTPEWGRMVTEGRQYLLSYWWVPLAPGFAIFTTVLGFNLIGDAIRDFADPRMRQ